MFQHKIDEIFNDMPNVFGIMDDILVVGYDDKGRDHHDTVCKVLQRCSEVNLKLISKLNKDKCHLWDIKTRGRENWCLPQKS